MGGIWTPGNMVGMGIPGGDNCMNIGDSKNDIMCVRDQSNWNKGLISLAVNRQMGQIIKGFELRQSR